MKLAIQYNTNANFSRLEKEGKMDITEEKIKKKCKAKNNITSVAFFNLGTARITYSFYNHSYFDTLHHVN